MGGELNSKRGAYFKEGGNSSIHIQRFEKIFLRQGNRIAFCIYLIFRFSVTFKGANRSLQAYIMHSDFRLLFLDLKGKRNQLDFDLLKIRKINSSGLNSQYGYSTKQVLNNYNKVTPSQAKFCSLLVHLTFLELWLDRTNSYCPW